MFRTVMALVLMAFVGLVVGVNAQEKKETTLTGDICCAKCELKESKTCYTVIRVKEKGKDVVYWFDEKAQKEYHKEICQTPKEGTVTGVVTEKDGKKWVKVSKVEFKKS